MNFAIINKNDDTALIFACQQIHGKPFVENVKIVEMLLERGANVNVKNNKNTTALFDSCGSNNTNIEIIKMLLGTSRSCN